MHSPSPREFQFTRQDFEWLRELIAGCTGIMLAESKRDLVYARLSRRLRQLNMTSFAEYCALLKDNAEVELGHLINAITTNLTSFFRERHHFEYLRDTLLPALREARRDERRLRIWSAGCSSGEEPYSIAMTVREALPAAQGWDVKILATDIDTSVLDRAERGVYDEADIAGVPEPVLKRWFLRGTGANTGKVKVKDELREIVSFRPLNLIEPWPIKGPFDIVFCRNVVIYFDKSTQRRLFNQFADVLTAGGYLFIGHSETLFRICDRFKMLGHTIYCRAD